MSLVDFLALYFTSEIAIIGVLLIIAFAFKIEIHIRASPAAITCYIIFWPIFVLQLLLEFLRYIFTKK